MSQNRSLGAWFRPLLFGTYFGAYAFATVRGFANGSLLAWMVYLLFANAVAAAQVACFVAVDVLLLKLKVRALPTGRAAWWMAFAAPMLVGAWVRLFPSPGVSTAFLIPILIFLLWFSVPMVAVALGLRLLFGRAPNA
jgi:hypothetical protein